MKKKIIAASIALPLALSTAFAQEEEEQSPYVVPVDTFTCNYNDGKGSADLDKVVAAWNEQLDELGADSYGAVTLTPVYYGNDTFDVGWIGYWVSQEAMGAGIDSYRASSAGELDPKFAEVLTCDTHSHFASIQVKAPPEGETPDNVVLMFSNCSKSDEVEWDALFDKIKTAVAYQEEKGFRKGDYMMWPVFGGEGKPPWDFKWVTSFANYTDFGIAYQHNANGGGRQKMNEIMGDALDCDPARVYDAKVVRRATAEMPE
jgi:hypothetical protein